LKGVAVHTDTTPKEKPTGSANNPAGHTDASSIPGPFARIKYRLTALAAWLAMVLKGVA